MRIATPLTSILNGGLAALALAALMPAAPARASDVPSGGHDPMSPEYRNIAMTVVETTGDYAQAADFLVRTALELDDADPEKTRNLQLAGRLYDHAGAPQRARLAILSAAVTAYRSGQPGRAAHLFLDAAELASQFGPRGAALEAADRAGWVLRNADLDEVTRRSVLARVVYEPEVEIRIEEPMPLAER